MSNKFIAQHLDQKLFAKLIKVINIYKILSQILKTKFNQSEKSNHK